MDLLVAPSIGFVQLYVLVIVRLERRKLVCINVTPHLTAEWIARQVRGIPLGSSPALPATQEHGARLSRTLELGRHPGACSSYALRGGARASGTGRSPTAAAIDSLGAKGAQKGVLARVAATGETTALIYRTHC